MPVGSKSSALQEVWSHGSNLNPRGEMGTIASDHKARKCHPEIILLTSKL